MKLKLTAEQTKDLPFPIGCEFHIRRCLHHFIEFVDFVEVCDPVCDPACDGGAWSRDIPSVLRAAGRIRRNALLIPSFFYDMCVKTVLFFFAGPVWYHAPEKPTDELRPMLKRVRRAFHSLLLRVNVVMSHSHPPCTTIPHYDDRAWLSLLPLITGKLESARISFAFFYGRMRGGEVFRSR